MHKLTKQDILRGGRKLREARLDSLADDIVHYKPLSAGTLIDFIEFQEMLPEPEDGKAPSNLPLVREMARIVANHITDENGELMFEESEAREIPHDIIKEMVDILTGSKRTNGANEEPGETEGNESSEAISVASPTA